MSFPCVSVNFGVVLVLKKPVHLVPIFTQIAVLMINHLILRLNSYADLNLNYYFTTYIELTVLLVHYKNFSLYIY